jgi:hypothetical protein
MTMSSENITIRLTRSDSPMVEELSRIIDQTAIKYNLRHDSTSFSYAWTMPDLSETWFYLEKKTDEQIYFNSDEHITDRWENQPSVTITLKRNVSHRLSICLGESSEDPDIFFGIIHYDTSSCVFHDSTEFDYFVRGYFRC